MEFSAKQIAEYIQGVIVGDENASVHTFAKIEEGIPGSISFLANPKYTHYIYDTKASIVLVNKDFEPEKEITTTLIKVDNAYESLAKLMTLYEMSKPKLKGIHPTASIDENAHIGEDVYVGPYACIAAGAVIGDGACIHPHATIGCNAKVGNNSIIYPHVTVYHDCRIGNNCIIHAGTVIGADGFGFAPSPEGYEKIPQIGIVILEDNVEIGANACIDRATMGATVIHKGVKLDNLIQIAHNVEIGSHTVMASQTGVAGSAKIGEWCMFGGQVGVAGHIKVGDHVVVDYVIRCGECYQCKHGRGNVCEHVLVRGSGTNGGWREYWCVEEPYVYKIDDSIPWKDAALIEPLTIGEHSTSRAGVCEDDVVFILGTGTIGTIIAQACKLKGAKTVICCDISDSSLERSKAFGADYTVNSKTQDIVAEVQKITNGHGCTVAFDSACFPGSLTMIMQPGIVCNAGRVVPMGFCTVPEKITQQMINGRELTICGTRMSLNQWIPTAQKMAEGKYHMEGLATTFVKFNEIEKVFDNIVHPDPAVKKTVILFDGAED